MLPEQPEEPGNPEPVLDSHVHLWDLDARPQPWIDPISMAGIHRTFDVADLRDVAARAGVSSVVLVQVLNRDDETRDLLRIADGCALVEAVVGWVDLESPDLHERVAALRELPGGRLLAGARHQAQAEPDPGEWLLRPTVRAGMRALGRLGLSVDLMLRPAQLQGALTLAHSLSEVRFVLDHAGKAPVREGRSSREGKAWARRVRDLASAENVVCKVSGLTTMADLGAWTVDDLRPFVEEVLDAFGADRLMVGSDWPVSLRAGDYATTVDAARTLVAGLTPAERRAVLRGTARRVYRLQPTLPTGSTSA